MTSSRLSNPVPWAAETWTTTADALARIEELRNTEHKVADAQRRIDDMQAAIALLGQRIGQLGELSPELAALPPIDAAEAFQRRLQAEHREAARCADADRRIEQAAAKLDRLRKEFETWREVTLGADFEAATFSAKA